MILKFLYKSIYIELYYNYKMDLSTLTKNELLIKCNELNIKKCSSKNKSQLIELIEKELNHVPIQILDHNVLEHNESKTFKFIDLFCGIGGFHQAMLNLNKDFKCVFASDIDKNCRDVYLNNFGLLPDSDIKKINEKNIPNFDILCGGFPCQTFSNSGKKEGFEDERGTLFEDILRIAIEKKPSFMFLENVKHIKKIQNGTIFEHIIKRINESGYVVNNETVFELSPHELGIPQHRERVIFVCIRNDIYDPSKKIIINAPNCSINMKKIIETDVEKTKKYRISKEIEDVLNAWDKMIHQFEVDETLSPTILCNEFYNIYTDAELNNLPDWKQDYIKRNKPLYEKYQDVWDSWYEEHNELISKKEIYGKLEWQTGKKKVNDSIWNYFIQLRQSGIRVKKSDYFPTLVAIVQTPIYAKERRYITPRECARLQSFPDSFILHTNDHTAYKQFGNAVNVDVAQYVIENALKTYGYI